MKNDALTTLNNAANVLLKMGFKKDEIKDLFFDGGKKSLLLKDDAVDVMTLYFRAKKLLNDAHVKSIMNKNEALRGSASISRDLEALYAYQSFVDELDHLLVVKNVGSGKKESVRTWEAYFKEKEAEYKKTLGNAGKSTKVQRDTFEDIKNNPYDQRFKEYLNTYMSDQVKNDIIYAVNDNESSLLMVKGLPFAVGKSKQESYVDIALKYLYADSKISQYQSENMKLIQLNKELTKKVNELESQGKGLSEIETAILTAIAEGNQSYLKALEKTETKLAGIIITNARARKRENEQVLDAISDSESNLKGVIINNGKARNREHLEQRHLLEDIYLKIEQLEGLGVDTEGLKKELITLREVLKNSNLSAEAIEKAKKELAGIEITNGKARKREHKFQNRLLEKINTKTTISAVITSLILAACLTGTILTNNYIKNNSDSDLKAYAYNESAELGDYEKLFNQLNVDGLNSDEQTALREFIEKSKKTDKNNYGFSTTNEMELMLENAVNAQNLANSNSKLADAESKLADAESKLADAEQKYDDVMQKYQDLLANNPTSHYEYVELLNKIINVSDLFKQSLDDNSLSAEEKAQIEKDLEALGGYQDNIVNDLASKFGVSLDAVLDSLDYQISNLNDNIDSLNNKISKLESQAAINSATINSLRNEINDLDDQIVSLTNQLANSGNADPILASALATANQKLAVANSTISNLSQKISGLEAENTELKSENSTLKTDKAALESTINSLNSQLATLNTKITGLESNITSLTNDKNALTSQVADLANKLAEANKNYDTLVANYNKLVSDNNNLVDEYDSVKQQLENALANNNTGLVAQLQEKVAELEKQYDERQAVIDALESELAMADKTLAEQEAKINELTNMVAQNDITVLRALYEQLTGKSSANLSNEEVINYISEKYDLNVSAGSSGALGDESLVPQK